MSGYLVDFAAVFKNTIHPAFQSAVNARAAVFCAMDRAGLRAVEECRDYCVGWAKAWKEGL